MAEIKDKVVTVESLSALHEYNKETYETKENVENALTNLGLSVSTGFDPSSQVVYKKYGKVVMVNLYYTSKINNATLNSWNTLFTLPDGYTPSSVVPFILLDNTNTLTNPINYYGRITSQGDIQVYIYNTEIEQPCGSVMFIVS